MPNRILKESICSNEQIDQLTAFEEAFFYRLIVNVDDFGRMDGRPSILRARLYPLRNIREEQIESALCSLATSELVHRYTVRGKPFVSLSGWERNQSIRAKKSKYPGPEESDEHLQALESNCMQMHADACKCSRDPIQSESNPIREAERAREAAARPAFDTLEVYASSNLDHLSPTNMDELVSFLDDLPEDVVRYAIDEACANGARKYAYVRSILNRYLDQGLKTIGAIKAAEERKKRENQPAQSAAPTRKVREFR